MSVWTHAAGIVRLDCLRAMYGNPEIIPEMVKEYFGKELRWDDDIEVWREQDKNEDKFLPCGSEGSLGISLWENPDTSHISSYVVSIFGDLRDFADAQSVIDWFKNKLDEKSMTEKIPCWVRQASIVVETEGCDALEYHC